MSKSGMKLNKKTILFLAITLVVVLAGIAGIFAFVNPATGERTAMPIKTDSARIVVNKKFGLPVDSFKLITADVQRNEFLSTILQRYHTDPGQIAVLAAKSKDIFDIRNIKAGDPYTIFCTKDSLQKACYFI
jgi:hypothetical protein